MSNSLFHSPVSPPPPISWHQLQVPDTNVNVIPTWTSGGGGHDQFTYGSPTLERKKFKHPQNMILQEGDDDVPFLTQADIEFDEFSRRKQLGSIIGFLSAATFLMPLLTAAYLPLELLNPNLFLAKSLVLLSIPLGVASLGRKRRRKRSILDEGDDTGHVLQSSVYRRKRGLIVIHRQAADGGISSQNNGSFPGPVLPILQLPPIRQLGNNTKMVDPDPDPSSATGDQCFQRIACEGLVNSLPQIFIRSVWKQQEEDFGNGGGEKSTEQSTENSRSKTMIRFKNRPGQNKRKNLAKYALGKIRPELGSKFGNKFKENSTIPGNPPKDLSKGWFIPPPPRNKTSTEVNPNITSTTTTPPSIFAIKLKHQLESIVQAQTSGAELPGTTNGNISSATATLKPPTNPCARYKCAFML